MANNIKPYLFRSRSFIAKHGVLLVIKLTCHPTYLLFTAAIFPNDLHPEVELLRYDIDHLSQVAAETRLSVGVPVDTQCGRRTDGRQRPSAGRQHAQSAATQLSEPPVGRRLSERPLLQPHTAAARRAGRQPRAAGVHTGQQQDALRLTQHRLQRWSGQTRHLRHGQQPAQVTGAGGRPQGEPLVGRPHVLQRPGQQQGGGRRRRQQRRPAQHGHRPPPQGVPHGLPQLLRPHIGDTDRRGPPRDDHSLGDLRCQTRDICRKDMWTL